MPAYSLTDIIKQYKSPPRKLIVIFKLSRDRWKAKSKKSKKIIKRLNNRIRFLNESKNKLKRQVSELKAELARIKAEENFKEPEICEKDSLFNDEQKDNVGNELFNIVPKNHTYTLGHIMLFLLLVLSSTTSLRGASRCMEIVFPFFGFELPLPSWSAGRLWLLRLGYYKLVRAKMIAEDWVWIIDHTIQIGVEKCLVILGIRLNDLPEAGTCIGHKDVEIIDMIPVKRSDGKIVYEQLTEAIETTGVPREIVGDNGSDLKAGIEKFCNEHPGACYVYDIKHKTAAVLKQVLLKDEKWAAFVKFASRAKVKVQQTPLAPLAPPQQRSKARYMNIGRLVKWGGRMLEITENPKIQSDLEYDQKQVASKLGQISEYRDSLEEWRELVQVVETTEVYVREQGLSRDCHKGLEKLPGLEVETEKAINVKEQLIEFVQKESLKAEPEERLLGSSEVIESLFGKLKYLERDQAKSGVTGLLLSIGAFVSETSDQVVQKAMETVRTCDITKWCKKMIGKTVQSKRKEAFNPP